jgi:hypothetical protein
VLVACGGAAGDVELLCVLFVLVVDVLTVVRVDDCEGLDEAVEDIVLIVVVDVPPIVVGGSRGPIALP